ncbi:sodium:proton antiporter [Thermoproteota archaeon]
MIYLLCLVLFIIGLYGVATKKNLIKIILGIVIMEYAVNLFLILVGYRNGGVAPVIDKTTEMQNFFSKCVDPLPQAMVLTSIVIGLGVLALMVAIAIRLYERYGTFDITKMKRLKG